MGGRGTSLNKGKYPYETEYKTLYQFENIKFIKYIKGHNAKSPMETQTKGRIYVTLDNKNSPKYITYFDENNKRNKQIDLKGRPHNIGDDAVLPHVHIGYEHNEGGARKLTKKEQYFVDKVLSAWENKNR